ncbi:GNAT family N-acetyltransferase [Pseudonocardia sp. ICBG1293]|uniref:GNAT family N-acetyltransferase n=1 Tax=Pseudonocardia sp. ICBG1293 TaxID=2844382 RepID=UPI001CCCD317|nr:GNAT family N-acetyltransferase [Pseudonocardia sp. ICBG1293]
MHLDLRRLDEPLLAALCDAAADGADPLEVMPPVPGPPGWTPRRRAAFLAFHRERSVAAAEPMERTWAVVVDGAVAGAARLEPVGGGEEAGIWLARSWRGRGVGGAVLRMLVDRADGPVVAETTADNTAAVAALHGLGAGVTVDGGAVHARMDRAGRRPRT